MKLTAESTVLDDKKIGDSFATLQVEADGIRTEVGTKVGNNEVISRINQTAESVKIQANKIQIDGVITAINNDTTTTINGGKITTDSIGANQIAANAVTANEIAANAVTADKIAANAVTAVKLDATTINASNKLTVGAMQTAEQDKILNSKLNIGGRNLLANACFSTSAIANYSSYISQSFTYYAKWATQIISASWLRANLAPSTQYTISFDYEVVSIESGITDARSQGIIASDGLGGLSINIDVSHRVAGYKTHCEKTWTTPSSMSSAVMYWYTFYSNSKARACNDTIRITNLKIEKGNKATAWSAADEDLAATATNYITHISNDGIRVHPSSTENNSVVINANGMEVFKGGTGSANSVAFYGDTARIGKSSTRHIEIKDGGMQVYTGSSEFANFGYGTCKTSVGTETLPYFSLGMRADSSVTGCYSVAEGWYNEASGWYSHAEGERTKAAGGHTHAEGYQTTASGDYGAHAEGWSTTASESCAHAEGRGTTASKMYTHAEGEGSTASAHWAHAEGWYTTASGQMSHAENQSTTASGDCSHAGGIGTIAAGTAQTAIGKYNVSNTSHLFIVGKGTDSSRANAFHITSSGAVYVNGSSVHSSDRRLKEHISYVGDEAIEFIDGLKPAHYIKDGEKHLGFYAQDVAEVDKWDCIIGEEMNGYMTLGYMELIAPMVAYIQRLEKRIEKLERSK